MVFSETTPLGKVIQVDQTILDRKLNQHKEEFQGALGREITEEDIRRAIREPDYITRGNEPDTEAHYLYFGENRYLQVIVGTRTGWFLSAHPRVNIKGEKLWPR